MKKSLILFDVDGTLCESGQKVIDKMFITLSNIKKVYDLGVVGGGKFDKLNYQFNGKLFDLFKYVFSESGNVAYIDGELLYRKSMRVELGNNKLTEIVDYLLTILSGIALPIKTGSFIDLRDGLIYFTPIGQNCTQEDRKQFIEFDKETGTRTKIVKLISHRFPNLDVSLGGQLGVSITLKGWDKGQVINSISKEDHNKIYFFGDKIYPSGNDYPLAIKERIEKYYQINDLEETYIYLADMKPI